MLPQQRNPFFWERVSQFSLRVWPLVGWWQPSGWLYICEYMGNTNWTQWAIKIKERKIEYEVEMGRRMGRGYGRLAVNLIKIHCMRTWHFQRVSKCCIQMHLFFLSYWKEIEHQANVHTRICICFLKLSTWLELWPYPWDEKHSWLRCEHSDVSCFSPRWPVFLHIYTESAPIQCGFPWFS